MIFAQEDRRISRMRIYARYLTAYKPKKYSIFGDFSAAC
jgi:hypothetical protein